MKEKSSEVVQFDYREFIMQQKDVGALTIILKEVEQWRRFNQFSGFCISPQMFSLISSRGRQHVF
jgi:hypothetical protein